MVCCNLTHLLSDIIIKTIDRRTIQGIQLQEKAVKQRHRPPLHAIAVAKSSESGFQNSRSDTQPTPPIVVHDEILSRFELGAVNRG